jgi:hypothetical protein
MNHRKFRRYPRNSPQAAGRILATALLANGDIKASEWRRLADTGAFDRLGLRGLQWHSVMDDLCQDLMAGSRLGRDCLIDSAMLAAWLEEVDDAQLQSLVLELCAEVIEADGEVHPGESLVLRAALEHWVLPLPAQARIEPLLYGLDFEIRPRPGVAVGG